MRKHGEGASSSNFGQTQKSPFLRRQTFIGILCIAAVAIVRTINSRTKKVNCTISLLLKIPVIQMYYNIFLVNMNCGAMSNENCTYFEASGDQIGACTASICKCDSNICQVILRHCIPVQEQKKILYWICLNTAAQIGLQSVCHHWPLHFKYLNYQTSFWTKCTEWCSWSSCHQCLPVPHGQLHCDQSRRNYSTIDLWK